MIAFDLSDIRQSATFGTRETFAIEVSFLEYFEPFGYAEIEFWIANNKIGNKHDTADLFASCNAAQDWLAQAPFWKREDLSLSPAIEVLEKLTVFDWGSSVRFPYESHIEQYNLGSVGDCSVENEAAVVMIQTSSSTERLCVCFFGEPRFLDVALPLGTCETVVRQYRAWCELIKRKHKYGQVAPVRS